MAKYIEREAACAVMPDDYYGCRDKKLLKSIPAVADVRPVVRGKWTRIDYELCGHDYKCSVCGWNNDMPTLYCPGCGAEMGREIK